MNVCNRLVMNKSTDLKHCKDLEQAKAGLKAFFRYTKVWKLKEHERLKLLSISDNRTYVRWLTDLVSEDDVSEELLDRLSQLINIYKILSQKHSVENQRLFLHNNTPAGLFKEKSPLNYMMGDYESLVLVRNYLEKQGCF